MLIIKYNGNLNVDADRLVTEQTIKKGIYRRSGGYKRSYCVNGSITVKDINDI